MSNIFSGKKSSTLFPATNFFPDKVGNHFLFRKEKDFMTVKIYFYAN